MSRKDQLKCFMTIVVLVLSAGAAQAAIINIETVPVGNLGNAGELCTGGWGQDRICGAVDYAYNIGKNEVTAGQYTAFLNAVAKTDPYGLYSTAMWSAYGCKIQRTVSSGSYSYSVAEDWANRPVNFVSWGDAARFANWLHNGQPTGTLTGNPVQDAGLTEDGAYSLNGATSDAALMAVSREADWKWAIPTEDEWYKAAYHKNDGVTGNYFDYPTGSDSAPSNDLTDPDGGNNANYNQNGYTIGSPYYTTEVGEFENSASPYGTFDQGGNVWEWNETAEDSKRSMRGSCWVDSINPDLLAANSRYIVHTPMYANQYLGFRVASVAVAVPEPGTLVIWSLLGLCGFLWHGSNGKSRE